MAMQLVCTHKHTLANMDRECSTKQSNSLGQSLTIFWRFSTIVMMKGIEQELADSRWLPSAAVQYSTQPRSGHYAAL
jgi:hypothetical protein